MCTYKELRDEYTVEEMFDLLEIQESKNALQEERYKEYEEQMNNK